MGDDLPGLKITVRELDDVILRDVGNKIKDSGKWPLIIDSSGQAATFLRYRDTNFIQALNPTQMEPEKIRLCILGALRYGKPAVLDMMQVDMYETCIMRFDEVFPGLMAHIMDKSILNESVYEKLIRESDGDDYNKNKFIDHYTQNFKFVILTENPLPPDNLVQATYPVRIHVPT